jgi:hypothetical protein
VNTHNQIFNKINTLNIKPHPHAYPYPHRLSIPFLTNRHSYPSLSSRRLAETLRLALLSGKANSVAGGI